MRPGKAVALTLVSDEPRVGIGPRAPDFAPRPGDPAAGRGAAASPMSETSAGNGTVGEAGDHESPGGPVRPDATRAPADRPGADPAADTGPLTELLVAASGGNTDALNRLFPLVYDELRVIARKQRRGWAGNETMNTTALVHEAYLKLLGHEGTDWRSRAHFLAVAATAMRQILIDYARTQQAAKRGGGLQRVSFERAEAMLGEELEFSPDRADVLVALDASLTRLSKDSVRLGRIVECRFFGGMSIKDTAEALGVSVATVNRGWAMAQAWLYRDLRESLES